MAERDGELYLQQMPGLCQTAAPDVHCLIYCWKNYRNRHRSLGSVRTTCCGAQNT